MSFRRMPFQFTTTDPVERQRELERRFGLPASRQNMFVDVPNPLLMGAVPREPNTSSSSPRLQHRVPIFVDGHDQPIHSSVDSTGSHPENKKPNVRVIPIEIEGAESRPARHRINSGPTERVDDTCEKGFIDSNDASPLKRSMEDLTRPSKVKNTPGPRVHNIPIQFEGSKGTVKNVNLENVKNSPKKDSKANGCTVTKPLKSPGKENKAKEEIKVKPEDQQKIENSLKKIENVLEELKTYEAEIQEFNGTTKDKKYRYLDEMLTRCMIKLDDIDTMGNENVRLTRKSAVKKVQAQIDLLESKANAVNEFKTTVVNESQAETSDINDSTSKKISDKSEQANEVEIARGIESELLEKEKKIVNIDSSSNEKLEGQPDVEMTESEADVKETNKETESQQDSKIKENEADVKHLKKETESEENSEMTVSEVDMEQASEIKPQIDVEMMQKDTSLPEVIIKEQTEDELDAEMVDKRDNEVGSEYQQSVNVHEIEIAESGDPAQHESAKNCEIAEADMTEKEDHEDRNEQIINSQDVEMSDVQSLLEDAKNKVLDEIAIESTSSQLEENEVGKLAEDMTCNAKGQETGNGPHSSETSNVDNLLETNN